MTKNIFKIYSAQSFSFRFFIFVIVLLSISCKSKKTIIPQTEISEKSTSFLLKTLGKNKVDAEWLSARVKVKYRGEDEKLNATANLRMRKDSVIWFNVKKAGVEAARVQITTDSVYIINRMDKEYTIKGLDFFEKSYNLPSSFEAIQNIVLGNVLYLSNIKPESKIKDNQHYLMVEKDNIRAEYWMEGLTYFLTEMAFTDIRNDRKFNMTFGDYEQVDEKQNFSYFRNLNVSGENTNEVDLDLKLSNVEINKPKSIKFDIPKRYKKVD